MNTNNIIELTSEIQKEDLENLAPNYKKGVLTQQEITQILDKIATDMGISKKEALIGTALLFLKGAASGGAPQTLSIELANGKTLAKKNITGAYMSVTGNNYIRRFAEAIAIPIGLVAEKFEVAGELALRINTALKAENGQMLTPKETAWCSSFSQNIPDLADRSSERLVKLLAEDYKRRFENKKKFEKNINNNNQKNNKLKRK